MKHLFRQTATIYSSSSTNEYGETTWSSGSSVNVRFQLKTQMVKGLEGEDVQADAVCFFDSEQSLTVGDRVDYDSNSYRILTLSEGVNDIGNVKLTKAILQRWDFSA